VELPVPPSGVPVSRHWRTCEVSARRHHDASSPVELTHRTRTSTGAARCDINIGSVGINEEARPRKRGGAGAARERAEARPSARGRILPPPIRPANESVTSRGSGGPPSRWGEQKN
jgi:hypothetical protein